MSEQEILEGNRIISEFDGWYHVGYVNVYNHKENEHTYLLNEFQYHSSWDWLMPVVEKIESLDYRWEIGMSSTTPYHYCKIWSIGTVEGISPLDATYGACVEFIKWYNSWTEK